MEKKENIYREEDLEYYMEEIRADPDCPYTLGNSLLTVDLFIRLKREYPYVGYFVCGDTQWITAVPEAMERLARDLTAMAETREKELKQLKEEIKFIKTMQEVTEEKIKRTEKKHG